MSALPKINDRDLQDLVAGAGWAGLDDDTKELFRQRDAATQGATRRRKVEYLGDQAGCPKVLS